MGSGLPLFLDQTEAPRAEKYLRRPGPPLSEVLDPPLVLEKQIQEKAPSHHEKNLKGTPHLLLVFYQKIGWPKHNCHGVVVKN